MKYLLWLLLFSLPTYAIDIEFVNHTGTDMRIDGLSNKCVGQIITPDKSVKLKNNEKFTVKNVTPVIHSYTICGSGLCSMTAMGIKSAPVYVFEVILDDGVIDAKITPDDWSIANKECP